MLVRPRSDHQRSGVFHRGLGGAPLPRRGVAAGEGPPAARVEFCRVFAPRFRPAVSGLRPVVAPTGFLAMPLGRRRRGRGGRPRLPAPIVDRPDLGNATRRRGANQPSRVEQRDQTYGEIDLRSTQQAQVTRTNPTIAPFKVPHDRSERASRKRPMADRLSVFPSGPIGGWRTTQNTCILGSSALVCGGPKGPKQPGGWEWVGARAGSLTKEKMGDFSRLVAAQAPRRSA
ncbi:hypothetical protein Pla175_27180 [Pirellulimonas nuda]|uniref:Uncharacterized protein n=1 Tax=Pirellulimonas nuda TaxID=2528009 RepID=A0A518DCY8_9BACT|nr:hypothetical protein Pla175_27180 [Pirellulimonas nuda]